MRYYVLDVNPEPWAIGPITWGMHNGRRVPYVGPNGQLQMYQEAIKEALREAGAVMLSGPVRLELYFWRRLESYQGFSKTSGAAKNRVRKNKPDVTNLQKATEDACQGILFENDRDVSDVHSVMVQSGFDVHGAVVIGIAGDNGLNLLDRLGSVVMGRIAQFNENRPPESDNTWIPEDEDVI